MFALSRSLSWRTEIYTTEEVQKGLSILDILSTSIDRKELQRRQFPAVLEVMLHDQRLQVRLSQFQCLTTFHCGTFPRRLWILWGSTDWYSRAFSTNVEVTIFHTWVCMQMHTVCEILIFVSAQIWGHFRDSEQTDEEQEDCREHPRT